MTSVSAMTTFVQVMLRYFSEPQTADLEAWTADLASDLASFPQEALEGAVRWFRQNRKFKSFPSIAECMEACRNNMPAPPEPKAPPPDPNRPLTPDSVDRLLRGDVTDRGDHQVWREMALQALNEGWLTGLHDFARDKRRRPNPSEVFDIRAAMQRLDDCINRGLHSPPGSIDRIMADAIIGRRKAMANRLFPLPTAAKTEEQAA